MEPTIQTTWSEFKQMASEYFKALPTANLDEADNGFKCLSLAYIGLETSTTNEQHQAVVLMELASTAFMKREAALS